MAVFVEDWAATYGSPYLVQAEEPVTADAELVEDGEKFVAHPGAPLAPDGGIAFVDCVRRRDLPVVGYVKTHYRALLSHEHHKRIPELRAGERSSLFRLGSDRYSCYLRLTAGATTSSPWFGIVRLEIPQSPGLSAAVDVADRVAGTIPRFAGVAHRDPRAPQNLQPIGALERHLRHLLGHAGLATRAVHEAVHALSLQEETQP